MGANDILTGDLPQAEQGLVPKLATASWKEINARDSVELLSFAGLASKWLGTAGNVVGGVAGAVVGGIDANSQFNKNQEILGVDVEKAAKYDSSAALEAIREKNKKIMDAIGNSSVSAVASIGTTAAALALLGSNPLGWVAGLVGIGSGIIGGIGGSAAYDAFLKSETKDTVELIAKLRAAQESDAGDIPPEAVAAALFSSMPEGDAKKRIEDRLEELTGTRSFHEAVKKEKYTELRELMHEFDFDIRTQTGILFDPENPTLAAAEQITQLINTRQLDARAVIFDKDNAAFMQAMQHSEALRANAVSNTPDSFVSATDNNYPPFPPGDENTPPMPGGRRGRV